MKVIIDIRVDSLLRYPYKTSKLGRVYLPSLGANDFGAESKTWGDFGITDDYFGGNIYKIACLKEKPWYILVNTLDETIGIMHRFEDLEKYSKDELKELCKLQLIQLGDRDSKEVIIEKLLTLKT